jgi:filamentous hemagglutinin family protein
MQYSLTFCKFIFWRSDCVGLVFLLLMSPLCLFSLGGKPDVVQGSATYTVKGEGEEVVKVSDKTILEYRAFNLEKHEKTRYEQGSSKSTLLCRVTGKDPSTIRGKLEANGRLLFINPNGIIFSETAQVNVGTLIASTLDIQNDDFLKDRYRFKLASGSEDSSIINKGHIKAGDQVVFMAARSANYGTIAAHCSTISMVGGDIVTLDFDGDGKIRFAIEAPLKRAYIEQAGMLEASQVYMELKTAQKAIQNVLNDTGIVEASRIEIEGGVIRLAAGGATVAKNGIRLQADEVHLEHAIKIKEGLLDISQAKKIVQHQPVESKNSVHYKADQILLGNSIKTDSTITLDGAVLLFKNDALSLEGKKFGEGSILLTSTLDADVPTRALTLQNGKSEICIQGAIGKKGPLRELVLKSKQVVFGDDIGSLSPGVIDGLKVQSTGVECRGSVYYAGEQVWNTGIVHLMSKECVSLKTTGGPLQFGPSAEIELNKVAAFEVSTQGGNLYLAKVVSDRLQPITIRAGQGEVHLKEIGQNAAGLHVEGKDIFLSGHVEGSQIFMEAENNIEYAKGKEVIATALKSTGSITLNSKGGSIGIAEKPLVIETIKDLYIGAKTAAYLKGECADSYPHSYSLDSSFLVFFNDSPCNLSMDHSSEMNSDIRTLTPALSHKTPTTFVEKTVLNPRKSSIYYDASSP